MPKSNKKQELVSNDILIAEFEYISRTASEANEDRGRIISFYNLLFTVGSLAVGFFISNKTTPDELLTGSKYRVEISLLLSFLFGALTYIIASNLAQLARLRAAWHESVEAMNQIKNLYIKRDPEIESGFKWRMAQIPPTDKPYSMANLVAAEVSLLGGMATSASLFFLLYAIDFANTIGMLLVIIGFSIGYISFWSWYKHLLIDNS